MGLTQTIVHEDGDLLYLIAPVSPLQPSAKEVEEYAYGQPVIDRLKQENPNPFIAWYGGHFVEADNPNGNGAMWTGREIALKSLTPRFMPVTVMHDPRSAVGLIADVRLRTPDGDQVPRAKLDTALAVWGHRFPEVVEEAQINYAAGTLMQSMECLAPGYSCAVCGLGFHKLPHQAERANWCAHLKGEGGSPGVRILAATMFTGSGLIFGTRGATGADPLAHLEEFTAEVAEFHQKRTHDTQHPTRGVKTTMEIEQARYDELTARPTRESYDAEVARANKAENDLAATETELVGTKARVEQVEGENSTLKEQANRAVLAEDRWNRLGEGFVAKMGEKTKARVRENAATMQDADWTARLEELAESLGVAPDAPADPTAPTTPPPAAAPSTPIFSSEEIAALGISGEQPAFGGEPVIGPSVVAALFPSRTKKTTPAAK